MNWEMPAIEFKINRRTIRSISKAIRKNGLKQAFGAYRNYANGTLVSACAIGQAAINLKKTPDTVRDQLATAYGNFKDIDCPTKSGGYVYSHHSSTLDTMVIHLNDSHKWSFERIANWLDKVAA